MELAQRSLPRDFRASLKRALWRGWLRGRYLLFQRHRHNRLALEHVAGRPYLVLEEVFNPKLFYTSEFLVASFDPHLIPPGSRVLDMGTGSGIGAVAATQLAEHVTAVDINPSAVRCARINALLNQVEKQIEVREGNLFEPVQGERFDVVLFNPPYYRGTPRNALDGAFRAEDVMERFVAGLPGHLAAGGHALVVLSSTGDTASFLRACGAAALGVEVVADRALVAETLTIYRLTTRENHSARQRLSAFSR